MRVRHQDTQWDIELNIHSLDQLLKIADMDRLVLVIQGVNAVTYCRIMFPGLEFRVSW